jgi:hypothetical protein
MRILIQQHPQTNEWEAHPPEPEVRPAEFPRIVISGPATVDLQKVWFKDPGDDELFGSESGAGFLPDSHGRVELDLQDVPKGEYAYSFRIAGETVDPKIIIERP